MAKHACGKHITCATSFAQLFGQLCKTWYETREFYDIAVGHRRAGYENGLTRSDFPFSCASFEARPARVEHHASLLHRLSRYCHGCNC
jgi:hypothetical protein